jgi:hypothetical protein
MPAYRPKAVAAFKASLFNAGWAIKREYTMRLATLINDTPDRQLVVVSPDASHYAVSPVTTLQAAMENWASVAESLAAIGDFPEMLDVVKLVAPSPCLAMA